MNDPARFLDQAPVFVIFLDVDGKYVWSNRVVYKFSPALLQGRMLSDVFAEKHKVAFQATLRVVIEKREIVHGKIDVVLPMVESKTTPYHYTLGAAVEADQVVGVWFVGWPSADETSTVLEPFLFSPLESSVVQYLRQSGPAKASSIARGLGMVNNSKLRVLLTLLQERSILAHSNNGYFISHPFSASRV
jgi:hypothetical protein